MWVGNTSTVCPDTPHLATVLPAVLLTKASHSSKLNNLLEARFGNKVWFCVLITLPRLLGLWKCKRWKILRDGILIHLQGVGPPCSCAFRIIISKMRQLPLQDTYPCIDGFVGGKCMYTQVCNVNHCFENVLQRCADGSTLHPESRPRKVITQCSFSKARRCLRGHSFALTTPHV